MTHYIGILDGSGDVWGVRIPDLPGCHGGGDSAEAAIADAISAAREWAEHQGAKGTALPRPRPLAELIEQGELDGQSGETRGDDPAAARQRPAGPRQSVDRCRPAGSDRCGGAAGG